MHERPTTRMPFGKYKGDLIEDVPSSYIVWLLENSEHWRLAPALTQGLVRELILRFEPHWTPPPPTGARGTYDPDNVFGQQGPTRPPSGPPPSRGTVTTERDMLPLIEEIITAGYRACARKYHPDTGGSKEQFVKLTDAHEFLKRRVRP